MAVFRAAFFLGFLPRRPLQLASAQQVDVEMGYFLPTVQTRIYYAAITARGDIFSFGDLPGYDQQVAEHNLVLLSGGLNP